MSENSIGTESIVMEGLHFEGPCKSGMMECSRAFAKLVEDRNEAGVVIRWCKPPGSLQMLYLAVNDDAFCRRWPRDRLLALGAALKEAQFDYEEDCGRVLLLSASTPDQEVLRRMRAVLSCLFAGTESLR